MTQIQKKWIGENEVGSEQILIEKDAALRGIDQDDLVVDLLKINEFGKAEILGQEIVSLEEIAIEAVVYVEKGGNDATANGSLARPFSTIMGALNSITDASVTKRYVVKVAPGAYSETNLKLKAGIFIVGESRDTVRITSSSTITLDSSFSGSGDHRSGFQQCIVISDCDFDWSTVTSAAGKLFFNEVSFSSTVRLYGHNNASAQAQFNSCIFFAKLTVSGINVGTHTNCFHFSTIDLLQHPNGGMATVLNAAGGNVGSILIQTTVNDFNRRCSLFARNFFCDAMTVDGPSSYADGTISSFPKAGATKLNGGNIVQLNEISHSRFVPNESNAHNLGDWGKQWAWHFAYVHATTGTDMYLGTYPSSFDADSVGKTVFIMPDLAGLQTDANGGDIALITAAVSGTGVRGKVAISARELDVGNVKITQVADGVNSGDAVNKSQLDTKLDSSLKGADNGLAELDAGGKVPASQLPSYVDDVLEYADLAAFPAIGETGIIYVAIDTGKVYRWSGSTYVEISAGPATTDDLAEGSTNLYFSDALAQSAAVVDSMEGDETNKAPSVSSVKDFISTASGLVIVEDEASLPDPGSVTKIYITKDDDKLWYYKEVSGGGEDSSAPALPAASVLPGSYDHTVGSGGSFATLEAALADAGVVDGDSIQVLDGTYIVSSTININKKVKIYGQSKAGVIFETAASTSDPVTMFNVSVDDVVMKDITIKHKKTSNTSVETAVNVSGPGSPQTRVANFIMDNCRIEHVEFALVIRGSNWQLRGSQFVYAGPSNSIRRHIGVYGTLGNCFMYQCESEDNGATGNTRWITPTSTTGTNPNETMEGNLVLEGNSQTVGNLQQFYSQDNWQGTAGSFALYVKGNTTNETSAFVAMFGASANFADILSKVEVSGNSLSNLHGGTPAGGKGALAFDGTGGVSPRSTALPVDSGGNTLANLDFRAGYVEAIGSSGSIVGYNSAVVAPVTVTLSEIGSSTTYEYTEISQQQPFENEKLVLTATDITNQYINLQHRVKHDSLQAYIYRLAIHQGDDYTLSVVGGKTRMTFSGDIATGGASALVAGDVLYVKYTFPGA
jgi:hypothetical protein